MLDRVHVSLQMLVRASGFTAVKSKSPNHVDYISSFVTTVSIQYSPRLFSTLADKISLTKEEKIAALEAELKKNKAQTMTTTSNNIGMKKAAPLEMF